MYTLLPWDTEVFGFGVAKLLPSRLSLAQLQNQLFELKTQYQIRLVYWASDPTDEKSQQAAIAANGVLVDEKTTFWQVIPQRLVKQAETITAFTQATIPEDLFTIAYLIGEQSRFGQDSQMPDHIYRKVYRRWLQNSVNRTQAQEVLVFTEAQTMIGFVTLGIKNHRGDIGLIGVAAQFHGRGVGRALVNAAQHYFQRQGVRELQVVTQRHNQPACALYQSTGFKIEQAENFYHFWL